MNDNPLESDDAPLLFDEQHREKTSHRWRVRRNRPPYTGDDDPPDEYDDQCGMCRFYVPLQGLFAADYGACTNERSLLDGRVMFEHDGCEHYSGASEWVPTFIALWEKSKKATKDNSIGS